MTSIVRRATPSQQRIMRAVAGAVKNALDAHPGYVAPKWLANSVAKRAAGTLTAGWREVLAAREVPSEQGRPVAVVTGRSRSSATGLPWGLRKGRASRRYRRSPYLRLIAALSRDLWRLKREDPLRAEIYVEVLRLIDKLNKE